MTGGLGDSPRSAIFIKNTPKGLSAAGAEQLILTQRFGQRDKGWTLKQQGLLQSEGRTYDTFHIALRDGTERTLYFEVTDWLARAQTHQAWSPKPGA